MEPFIRGGTRIVGLLGYPVAHSISPQIHNHAFKTLALPYVYIPLPVMPAGLPTVVNTLRAVKALGANVTLPHKQAAAALCDELSPLSKKLGTVNTLFFKNDTLCGTTTDPQGFLRALARMGHDAHDGNVVIIGNGGTARTLATSLALEKIPRKITLTGRNPQRVAACSAEIAATTGISIPTIGVDSPDMADVMAEATLLVNCTSAGLYPNIDVTPIDKKFFHRGLTVFDTIYNPVKTRFLAEAESAGCACQNGLGMLLYQALASSTLWTGIDVREEIFNMADLQNLISK